MTHRGAAVASCTVPAAGRRGDAKVAGRTPWHLAPCLLVVSLSAMAADHPPREFTPRAGFDGVSRGTGTLRMLWGKPRPFVVDSRGATQADGSFRLLQTITMQGKPPRNRVWIIRTVGPGRYRASLSDAPGPVTGTHAGPTLSLRYRVMGPLTMDQRLELLPDGRTIDNVGTLTFLGMRVGRLQETIIREAPSTGE